MKHTRAAWCAWLRWLLPAVVALLGARQEVAAPVAPLASGSGDHAWWVVRADDGWLVQHAARGDGVGAPLRRDVARFADRPVAVACDGAAAWVMFQGSGGRSEVLGFQAAYNPVSRLWFSVPAGGRLFASLPAERVESVAAIDGEPWAIEADAPRAWRLQGERWVQVPLPAESAQASARRLVTQGGALWCLSRHADGSAGRWRREGQSWRPVPVASAPWSDVVPGCSMLTLIVDGRLSPVQAGAADAGAALPQACAAVGWGDGVLALRVVEGQAQASVCTSVQGAFGPFVILPTQRSGASRWYHLPLLGVLSLAALMLAGTLRVIQPQAPGTPRAPMPLGRRAVALLVDVFPLAAASALMFEAGPAGVLRVPLWTTDIADSVPFLAMVAGTTAFGFMEEAVGARSVGKRLMGGCVLGRDGARAGWIRHLIRNLLKALVLVSPVLALPALSRRRHEGIPEVVSGTVVVGSESAPPDVS